MAQEQNSIYPLSIKTLRLLLREWESNHHDHELMYTLESQPEVVRYQDWEPRSREEAAKVVDTIIANQAKTPRSHVELAVFRLDGADQAESGFIGRVGTNITYDATPLKANLWFAFLPFAQGKGYAKEAMEAFIAALRPAGVKSMEIECDPRNQGSRRLAERLGFEKVKEVERAWESKGEWVGSVEFVKDFN